MAFDRFQGADEEFADLVMDGADIELIDINCPPDQLRPAACFTPSCRTS